MKPVKSVICLLLVGLMLLSLAACRSEEPQIIPETDDTTVTSAPTTTPAATPAVTGFVFPPAEALKVFADGAYSCRVMCPTAPTALEQTMYTHIREALESITGVLPELATDFLATDEQGNLSSDPAILIGQTAYDESTAVYQDLAYGEFRMQMVGNKLVLAFSTELDADTVAQELAAVLQPASDGSVTVSADTNRSYLASERLLRVPSYPYAMPEVINCDRDTFLLYVKNGSEQDLLAYLGLLTGAGYQSVSSTQLQGNRYETLVNGDDAIYLYYTAYSQSIRIVCGPTELLGASDCSISAPEQYTSTLTFVNQPGNIDCGQGYIFLLPDGRFLVHDGGYRANNKPDYLYKALTAVAPDPSNITIAAWFISHPHPDHQLGFEEFVENHGADEGITVERVIFNYIQPEEYAIDYAGDAEYVRSAYAHAETYIPDAQVIKAHTGQTFVFGSVRVEILYTVEDLLPVAKFDSFNTSSMAIRLNTGEQTILFLADTTKTSGTILEKSLGDYLKSDIMQLAHHGYGPVNNSLYETVQAEVLLWPNTYATVSTPNKISTSAWKSINIALQYAKDVHFSDADMTTLTFPYQIQNNKACEMAHVGK